VLVGGPTSSSGNVFARNPSTGIYGPVCDDFWNIADVKMLYIIRVCFIGRVRI
jgi:hypothetical protein